MNQEKIKSIVRASIEVKTHWLNDETFLKRIDEVATLISDCYNSGCKVLFAGNGGSAADAQHLAAELSGRFYQDREPLDAEALHVNTSYLTAVANDYSYAEVYSRLVKAKGRRGDILIVLSTSGNSENILRAVEAAQVREMKIVGLTGSTGGKLKQHCQYLLNVPSNDTPRIQESHILIGHIICQMVEEKLFNK